MTEFDPTSAPDRVRGALPEATSDPAQQSLAEAMQLSFGILRVVMLALVAAYAVSGLFSVGSNEVALRLRFGRYVGQPGEQVLD